MHKQEYTGMIITIQTQPRYIFSLLTPLAVRLDFSMSNTRRQVKRALEVADSVSKDLEVVRNEERLG